MAYLTRTKGSGGPQIKSPLAKSLFDKANQLVLPHSKFWTEFCLRINFASLPCSQLYANILAKTWANKAQNGKWQQKSSHFYEQLKL